MESSRVFVSNLPPSITETALRQHFSAKGREVTDVKLIAKRRIGYIGYKSPEEATKAVKYFNRSYIRLSKISAELAKPIGDPSLHPKHAKPAVLSAASVAKTNKPTPSEEKDSKKRKREPADEADPKFQEYMQLMNPSATKKNLREVASSTDIQAPPVLEAESDDEYEEIPVRPSKKQKEQEDKRPEVLHDETHAREPDSSAPPPDTTAPLEDASPDIPVAAATDDDWLRSRTNRLLDLVDPDDPSLQASTGASAPESQKPEEPSTGNQERELDAESNDEEKEEHQPADDKDSALEAIEKTARLFVRNLPYSVAEDDLRSHFEAFGSVKEVQLPLDKRGHGKGIAMVLFEESSDAITAFQQTDGTTYQGRLIHVLPGSAKRDANLEDAISGLPLKKQNLIRKRAEAATNTFNWNSLYMSQDAVNTAVANRLGVSKAELLDPTSSSAGVTQAIAETSIIQETKSYFAANGVDLDAFKSKQRGDTSILVKNFPYGTTIDELRKLFEEFGTVLRVLMPPSGTIAIVQFAHSAHIAFARLAYRRIKDSVLFLEKGPKDLFTNSSVVQEQEDHQTKGTSKLSVSELLERDDQQDQPESSSLFVRLSFQTTTDRLADTFRSLEGFVAAQAKTKPDPKKAGQLLSMGYGFVTFRTKEQAQAALKVVDGYVLDEYTISAKASHRGLDAAAERRKEDLAKKQSGQHTKIVIKNLPFEASKKDIRTLFATYGKLTSVRLPKKFNNTSRGFAFVEFVSPREAENAFNALQHTHLLGRRLVLDFAEAEALDAEEEIARMTKKVGGQVNKVTLQELTGRGRQKVDMGGGDEDDVIALTGR